jgi:aspartyl-tRNA(Asn)/glutamyl-tRNA(Gln) amidotransferase subunit A
MPADAHTVADLSRLLQTRAITSEEVTQRCLACIEDRDQSINAFITVLSEQARAQARAADSEIAAGRYRGPLHGVPISLKDLIDVRGTPTTAASRVRAGHVATGDAAVTTRLRDAGAVFVGKTNLHEFAFGTTNEDSAYGPVHHPLDLTRSPGGSSGGSAASVLAGMAFASIGTDTGGSIRIPSSVCGLVGLKPALGEVPTDGVVPLSTVLDHVGPMCRSVDDASVVFQALRGTRNPTPTRPRELSGLRFGVPRPYFLDWLDPEVAAAFDAACARLTRQGVVLQDVAIPHAPLAGPVYVHLALPEAAAYHAATLDSRPDDYTPNVRFRIELGRYVLAQDYIRAMMGREALIRDVNAALEHRDGLLLPTMPMPATTLGATTISMNGVEEPIRNAMLRLTQVFNITGHPAITVPCGKTRTGLPIGLQAVGTRTSDLIDVAAAIERVLEP